MKEMIVSTIKRKASKSTNKPADKATNKVTSEPTSPAPATASVHDLVGSAAIALPRALREILGDEAYEEILTELGDQLLTMIIRRPEHIVYVYAKLTPLDLDADFKSPAPAHEAGAPGDVSSAAKPAKLSAPREATDSASKLTQKKKTSTKAGKSGDRQPRGRA